MAPRLTIKLGAAHDEVVIDGHTFDRSGLTRNQRNAMTSLIVESLFPNKPAAKQPRRRPNRRKPRVA